MFHWFQSCLWFLGCYKQVAPERRVCLSSCIWPGPFQDTYQILLCQRCILFCQGLCGALNMQLWFLYSVRNHSCMFSHHMACAVISSHDMHIEREANGRNNGMSQLWANPRVSFTLHYKKTPHTSMHWEEGDLAAEKYLVHVWAGARSSTTAESNAAPFWCIGLLGQVWSLTTQSDHIIIIICKSSFWNPYHNWDGSQYASIHVWRPYYPVF